MGLKFYYDLMSQPCRALYIFLKMTGIPYEAHAIALRKMEHMTDDFKKLNPLKKVPVIDDSGFVLTESVAIFNYLADKYKKSDWYPTDLNERARVDEYNHWQHSNLRFNGSGLFQTKVIIPVIKKTPPTEQNLQKWHKKWQESTNVLENHWLKRSTYLAGNRITTSDLLGVCEMMQPIAAGYNLDANRYPRVDEWMNRVKNETQPYFNEAHEVSIRLRYKIFKDEKSKS